MAITYGTYCFVSKAAAVRYYMDYESGTRSDKRDRAKSNVTRSLAEGSICIGKPTLQLGETLSVIDNGTRYAITEAK